MKRPAILLSIMLCFLMQTQAQTREYERIRDFSCQIEVLKDGSVRVSENITVYADLERIKRGIFRSLPVRYRDSYGNRFRARYSITGVMKNGIPEPYHIKNENGFLRVYIGDKNVYLVPGEYTYTINYTADRMIGFYKAYDEIYWNVTGNQWDFEIEKASVRVILPQGTEVFTTDAYTGIFGSRDKNFSYQHLTDGSHYFTANKPLAPREGLTIAIGFNKGIIIPPDGKRRLMYILQDNKGAFIGILLIILMLVWFLYAWIRVGRDPAKESVPVLYYPPAGYSPASLRYLLRMGFDPKAFSSNIVMLAVKGLLSISHSGKVFTLKKNEFMQQALTQDEKALADSLFSDSDTLTLTNTNHKRISTAQNRLRAELKRLHHGKHFNNNTRWYMPCLLISLLSLAAIIVTADEPGPAAGISIWMLFWGLGTWSIISAMTKKIRLSARLSGRIARSLLLLLLLLPMLGGLIGGALQLGGYLTPLTFAVIFLTGCLNALFYKLLKAPTPEGRRLMDQAEGFREYLSVAEKDELEYKNPPEKNPALFEKYLPYAIALGVENRWGEKFTSILDAAVKEGSYQPAWYTGTALTAFTASAFTHSLSQSFSSALTSASVAPGSSSGSGGGGFSGGGGGGGGGGGW